jgi:hypothetical protein
MTRPGEPSMALTWFCLIVPLISNSVGAVLVDGLDIVAMMGPAVEQRNVLHNY